MNDTRAARLIGTGLSLWILAWVLGIMFSSFTLGFVLSAMGMYCIAKSCRVYTKV